MLLLCSHNNPLSFFLRIEKNNQFWTLFIKRGVKKEEISHNSDSRFDFLEEVLMNKNDLLFFSKELKSIILSGTETKKTLNLTFQENKPDFKLFIDRIRSDSKEIEIVPFHLEEELKQYPNLEIFKAEVSFLGCFSAYRDRRPENQNLYRNKTSRRSLITYFSDNELLAFADELEKEVMSEKD